MGLPYSRRTGPFLFSSEKSTLELSGENMFRRLHLPIFFLLCLFSDFAFAQDIGRVIGQIRILRGDFPPRAIMVDLQFRGATMKSVYSDSEGRFGFYELPSNLYHVIVNDDDYYAIDEEVNLNLAESAYAMVQIQLRPREKKTADPLEKQVAGSNPYIVDLAEYNKRSPKKAVKEYDKGLEAERQGKKDAAIEHYQASLKVAPDYYPAHNNLGALYLGSSDFKSAEEQLREAVRLDRNEAQAYFNLSNLLILTKRFADAQITLAQGLQRRPDSAFGNFLQGCLYDQTGMLSAAENSLQSALRLDPKMSQAHLQLVNLYLKQNRRQDAIKQLQAFLQGFPNAPSAPKAKEILSKLQTEDEGVKH
jgi:tetratricopeptide (TPR) repeat protein